MPTNTAASTAPLMISEGSMPGHRVSAGLSMPPAALPMAVTASRNP
jgi:hypothetical protein